MQEVKPFTYWHHFKGFDVLVLTIAKHTETNETLVIYSCFNSNNLKHKNGIYARPIKMFLSKVDKNKFPTAKQEYRFEKIEESNLILTN